MQEDRGKDGGGCSRLMCVETLYGMWAGWSRHARCGHDCSQIRIKKILVEGEAGEGEIQQGYWR